MKKSLYNLLSMIPIYGTFLKFSSKGEMRLCSPLYQDFSRSKNISFGLIPSSKKS